MLPISYRMNNRINGVNAVISGNGHWVESGSIALNLEVSRPAPKNWNAIILPCICSGPGPGPEELVGQLSGELSDRRSGGLISIAPAGYKTAPKTLRRATLWDKTGDIVAEVSATGVYKKSDTELDFVIEVETQTYNGTLLESLDSIDSYAFTIDPVDEDKLHVTSHYSLSSQLGGKVFGTTDIVYQLLGDLKHNLSDGLVGFNDMTIQTRDCFIQYISQQYVYPRNGLGLKNVGITPL